MAKKGERSKRPTALVKPAPARPAEEQPQIPLLMIIERFSMGRAYTVISQDATTFKIHFEGDSKPSVFTVINGKVTLKGGDLK